MFNARLRTSTLICILLSTIFIASTASHASTVSSGQLSAGSRTSILGPCIYPGGTPAPITYKPCLSEARKKLSTDLVELLDARFIPAGQSRADVINTMKRLKQYVPANTYSKGGKYNCEMVYVYVYLAPATSTGIVDQYAWQVTNRDEKNHIAVAWVEVNKLDALASLAGVRSVQTVLPPMTR